MNPTLPDTDIADRWKPLFDLAGKDVVDPEAYKELRAASMMPAQGWFDDVEDRDNESTLIQGVLP